MKIKHPILQTLAILSRREGKKMIGFRARLSLIGRVKAMTEALDVYESDLWELAMTQLLDELEPSILTIQKGATHENSSTSNLRKIRGHAAQTAPQAKPHPGRARKRSR